MMTKTLLWKFAVELVNRGDSYSGEVKADFYRNGEWHWYQIRGKGVLPTMM